MITDLYDPAYYRQSRPQAPAWPATEPIPEVLSTDEMPEGAPEVPRAVQQLQKAAQGAGWVVRVGYSRSPERAVKVGEYKITECFGVWSDDAHGWRFNAMYTRTVGSSTPWAWRSTAIWPWPRRVLAPGLGVRFTHATVTDLKEWISVRASVLPAWFKGVHARVEEQREQARLKARTSTKRTSKEGMS